MSAVAAFLQRREEEKLAEKPVIGHKIHPVTNINKNIGHKIHPVTNRNQNTLATKSSLNVKIKSYNQYKYIKHTIHPEFE